MVYGAGWVYTLLTKYRGDPPVAGFCLKRSLVALVSRNIQSGGISQHYCRKQNRSGGMGTVVFPAVPSGVEMVYGVVEVTRSRQRCRSTLAAKNLR